MTKRDLSQSEAVTGRRRVWRHQGFGDRQIFGDLWIFEGVCLGWTVFVHLAQSPNEIDWKSSVLELEEKEFVCTGPGLNS